MRGETERWVAGTKPIFISSYGESGSTIGAPPIDHVGPHLIDLWSVSGKTITISTKDLGLSAGQYNWDGHPDTGVVFRIVYVYFDTYDPSYVPR